VDAGPPDAASPTPRPAWATRSNAGRHALLGCIDGLLHLETCDYGCLTTAPGPHCAVPVLSNGLDLTWLDGADRQLAVPPTTLVVFDTTSGHGPALRRRHAALGGGGHPGASTSRSGRRPRRVRDHRRVGVRSLRVDAAASVR
jgi:hypothetical protein